MCIDRVRSRDIGRVGRSRDREATNIPGNSVSETGDRMNGGAVKDDKSPEKEAILHIRTLFCQHAVLLDECSKLTTSETRSNCSSVLRVRPEVEHTIQMRSKRRKGVVWDNRKDVEVQEGDKGGKVNIM